MIKLFSSLRIFNILITYKKDFKKYLSAGVPVFPFVVLSFEGSLLVLQNKKVRGEFSCVELHTYMEKARWSGDPIEIHFLRRRWTKLCRNVKNWGADAHYKMDHRRRRRALFLFIVPCHRVGIHNIAFNHRLAIHRYDIIIS